MFSGPKTFASLMFARPASNCSVSNSSCAEIFSKPTLVRYSKALAKPTACAMLGTPASKRRGDGAQVASSIETFSIIEPPKRNGGRSSSNSLLPQSTPMPVGPSALCPEKVRKSTPSFSTSIALCGADWQASRTTTAPTSCARATICSSGLIVPSTLD